VRSRLVVNVEATGGVEEEDGDGLLARPLEGTAGDVYGLVARRLGIDGDVELLAELLELLHGGGALHVERDHRGLLALLAEVAGELGGVRGLAGALQADEHEDGGRRGGEGDARLAGILPAAAEHRHQFVVDDADHLLRRREALQDLGADRALLHLLDELFDELEVDVGFEQRLAHLAHGVFDVFLGDLALAAEPVEDGVEALGQAFKHAVSTSWGERAIATCHTALWRGVRLSRRVRMCVIGENRCSIPFDAEALLGRYTASPLVCDRASVGAVCTSGSLIWSHRRLPKAAARK
jgi:hypothetical protein